jgi:hypothetical protein
MATGSGFVLNPRPDLSPNWQLLKTPTGAQTAVTAAKLCQTFRDVVFAEDNFEVIDCMALQSIAVQVWGVAADTNTFTLELYGWSEGGPGRHIQQMAANIFGAFVSVATDGWHASPSTHESIKYRSTGQVGTIPRGFAPATEYRGVDTYLLTAAKDFTVKWLAVTPAAQIQTNAEADFPGEFVVDFRNSRFKYFGVAATATTGTSVGAIFKPLSLRI